MAGVPPQRKCLDRVHSLRLVRPDSCESLGAWYESPEQLQRAFARALALRPRLTTDEQRRLTDERLASYRRLALERGWTLEEP